MESLEGFFIPFITLLLAELGDKSQISLLLLSARTKKHLVLFLGAMLGFVLVDGVAILFGSFLTSLVPDLVIKYLSAALFILFGLLLLIPSHQKSEKILTNRNIFLAGFASIFFTEWGDKTQLASMAFATRFNPLIAFLGIISALGILAVLAVFIGSAISKKLNRDLVSKIGGIIFLLVGLFFALF